MTRVLVILVGSIGCALPLWALGTYPVEDSFARVLVGLILGGLGLGVAGLFLRAKGIDRMLADLVAFDTSGHDIKKLAADAPELHRLVEAKLQGERTPVARTDELARYLVSSLVLMGLLGTFVGLVDALIGARDALSVSTDVSALRSALLAPMRGLSRAFGTSVAGISSSAMLGLALVLLRRAEARVHDRVQRIVAGPLQPQTLAARQVLALERLGSLGDHLPAAVERMAEDATALPAVERSFLEGHEALGNSLKASAERVAADLKVALDAGLATMTGAHDALIESAVTKASAVLEERATQLTRLFEENARTQQSMGEAWQARMAEQTSQLLAALEEGVKAQGIRWQEHTAQLKSLTEERVTAMMAADERRAAALEEQEAKQRTRADERDQRLSHLLETAATVAERAAAAAGAHADELMRFIEGQRDAERALAAEFRRFLEERKEDERELVVELRAFLDANRADDHRLGEELRTWLEARRGDDKSLVGELQQWLDSQRLAHGEMAAELQRFAESQRGEDRALAQEFKALVDAQRGADRALVEQMRSLLDEERSQSQRFATDMQGQMEQWLSRAAERDAALDVARVALEEKLAAERAELTRQVVTHLDTHAGAVRGEVEGVRGAIEEGADALVAGGVELSALAERLAVAVDGFSVQTREQLDRLGTLEVNLTTGGADNERERFGSYLDQTRVLFEQSLELQRELFQGVKGSTLIPEPTSDDELDVAAGDPSSTPHGADA